MKLKRKEDQRVDASVLLRRGNKIIKGSCTGWFFVNLTHDGVITVSAEEKPP